MHKIYLVFIPAAPKQPGSFILNLQEYVSAAQLLFTEKNMLSDQLLD